MKISSLFIFVLFITASSLDIFPQTRPLVNTWKIEESSIPRMTELFIQRIKKMNPEQAKQLAANPDALIPTIKLIEYTFRENGVYEVKSSQGLQKGTWNIAHNDLITQIADGVERKDSIILMTNSKVVIFSREIRKSIEYIPANAVD